MLLSASRFYFSQRSEPQQDYSHRNILTICFFLSLILLTRLASFAVFFSYSRTFLSVPVIVLFGIAHLAMFYDQLVEEDKNFNQLDQLVLLLASCWAPCIPGLKKFYLIKTSLANFTLHILCHSIYLIHILTLQVLSVKYLPLRFHCFPTQIPELYGQYCIVENRTTILTQNCTLENGGEENLYAQMCLENESPNSDYLVTTLLIVLCLFTSLLPKFVLFKLEKNMSNLQSVFSCCKPNKHQSVWNKWYFYKLNKTEKCPIAFPNATMVPQCIPNASPMRLQCVPNVSPMRPQCAPMSPLIVPNASPMHP